jgi:hypothetical protein
VRGLVWQLDKALMVSVLLLTNVGCWITLLLSDRVTRSPLPAPDASIMTQIRSLAAAAVESFSAGASSHGGSTPVPLVDNRFVLPLSARAKTLILSGAAASLAIPASLPFAIFSIDFGKEGAALLSSILSAVGSIVSLVTLRFLPRLQKSRSWFFVHAALAVLGIITTVAMSAVMLADQRKFAKGYIISETLFNTTVVTLHGCSRPSCGGYLPWRPGSRRWWQADARRGFKRKYLLPWAPVRTCHRCGKSSEVVEFKVEQVAAELVLLTPFKNNKAWVRTVTKLRKPPTGWKFANPTRYPIARGDVEYGDQSAFERRRQELLEAHEEREREERERLEQLENGKRWAKRGQKLAEQGQKLAERGQKLAERGQKLAERVGRATKAKRR